MSPNKILILPPLGQAVLERNGSRGDSVPARSRAEACVDDTPPGIWPYPDRAEAVSRLERLRSILPVIAREHLNARREAASLRAENGRLLEQVGQLQRSTTRGPGARANAARRDARA